MLVDRNRRLRSEPVARRSFADAVASGLATYLQEWHANPFYRVGRGSCSRLTNRARVTRGALHVPRQIRIKA